MRNKAELIYFVFCSLGGIYEGDTALCKLISYRVGKGVIFGRLSLFSLLYLLLDLGYEGIVAHRSFFFLGLSLCLRVRDEVESENRVIFIYERELCRGVSLCFEKIV